MLSALTVPQFLPLFTSKSQPRDSQLTFNFKSASATNSVNHEELLRLVIVCFVVSKLLDSDSWLNLFSYGDHI